MFFTPWYKWKRLKSRYFYQHGLKFALYAALSLLIYYADGILPSVLSVAFAIAATILVVNILFSVFSRPKSKTEASDKNFFYMSAGEADDPDIYHIVLDSYAGPYALKLINNFDNGEFYQKLRKLGFKVTDNAYSNYNHTSASLSSVANMGYTGDFLTEEDFRDPAFVVDNQHYRFLYVLKSKIIKILKSRGYKIITTGEPLFGDFCLSACANFIDTVGCNQRRILKNSLYANFFKTTVLGGIFTAKNTNMVAHADYIKEVMTYVESIPVSDDPFYSFVHVWAPHAPFCFNEDGSINKKFADIGDVAIDDAEARSAYIAHLKYVNTLLEKTLGNLIEKIKARGRRAVLLIHGDHGVVFRTKNFLSNYNVLLGIYTYGFKDDKDIFPSYVSLVNMFPCVLRHCFGINIEIKDNKYFYENEYLSDYNEREITDEMKELIKQAAGHGDN